MSVEEYQDSPQIDGIGDILSMHEYLYRAHRFFEMTGGKYKPQSSIFSHVMKRLDTFSEEPTDADYVSIIKEAIIVEQVIDEIESTHIIISDADCQQRINEALLNRQDN